MTPNTKNIVRSLSIAIILFASTISCIAKEEPKKLLYGHINELGSIFVSSGVIPQSTQFPTPVLKVRQGSPAYYAGVQANDQILNCKVVDHYLILNIKRNGQVYLAKLRAKTDKTPKALQSQLNDNQSFWDRLSKYDIELVIDHSGSMFNPLETTGKDRWQWIEEQVPKFCNEVQIKAGNRFGLCLFNTTHQTYNNLSATDVTKILTTSLAAALTSVFKQRHKNTVTKPLLLIILTDGQTLSTQENADVILNNQSNLAGKDEFKIVCIQAGRSNDGAKFVEDLRNSCAQRGLENCVNSLLFEDVSRAGIVPFLMRFMMAQ